MAQTELNDRHKHESGRHIEQDEQVLGRFP